MPTPMIVRPAALLAVLALAACGSDLTGPDTVLVEWAGAKETHTILIDQELDLKLGTVGFGQFDSLPEVSTGSIRFLGSAFVGPFVPGGPRQLFRFVGERPGTTVVTFRHTGAMAPVTTTVVVENVGILGWQ